MTREPGTVVFGIQRSGKTGRPKALGAGTPVHEGAKNPARPRIAGSRLQWRGRTAAWDPGVAVEPPGLIIIGRD